MKLSRTEQLALWILSNSKRIVSLSITYDNGDRLRVKGSADPEPPSMQLERIYHQPSYGESE